MKAINRIKHFADWNYGVKNDFEYLWPYWDKTDAFTLMLLRGDKPDRAERIARNLELRARNTHNPERYKNIFTKNRYQITIPNLQTYTEAIRSSKGELRLLQNFLVQGI